MYILQTNDRTELNILKNSTRIEEKNFFTCDFGGLKLG